jgi:hypothetical protein
MINNNQPNVLISDSPRNPRSVKWCSGHWADLMHSLNERGLGAMIAPTSEELSAKLARGDTDPCWDACNMINIGAFEIFGPEKVLGENDGCPVCAFANIVQHAADLMVIQHGVPH